MPDDIMLVQTLLGERQELRRNVAMYKQAFRCVADRDALALGIFQNIHSHGKVGAGIDIDMAVAHAGLDNRNRSRLDNGLNQAGRTARNQHVNETVCLHHNIGALVRGVLNQI